jgi:hypothetical protein
MATLISVVTVTDVSLSPNPTNINTYVSVRVGVLEESLAPMFANPSLGDFWSVCDGFGMYSQ